VQVGGRAGTAVQQSESARQVISPFTKLIGMHAAASGAEREESPIGDVSGMTSIVDVSGNDPASIDLASGGSIGEVSFPIDAS
jgi:hypothetical protein